MEQDIMMVALVSAYYSDLGYRTMAGTLAADLKTRKSSNVSCPKTVYLVVYFSYTYHLQQVKKKTEQVGKGPCSQRAHLCLFQGAISIFLLFPPIPTCGRTDHSE